MRWTMLLTFTLFTLLAPPAYSRMEAARDLQALGQLAQSEKLPIVLMFSAQWCEFCDILKEEVLNPMAANPEYEGRIAFFRLIHIDRDDLPLVDFTGRRTTHHAFAEQFEVDLTPTVWIVDGEGRSIAEPLIGLPGGTVETYSETLFARLETALKALGHASVSF